MKREIFLNDFGEMLEKVTIRKWHADVDQDLSTDDSLVSFETAKAIMEAPVPVEGKLVEILCQPGEQIVRDQPIAVIEVA